MPEYPPAMTTPITRSAVTPDKGEVVTSRDSVPVPAASARLEAAQARLAPVRYVLAQLPLEPRSPSCPFDFTVFRI